MLHHDTLRGTRRDGGHAAGRGGGGGGWSGGGTRSLHTRGVVRLGGTAVGKVGQTRALSRWFGLRKIKAVGH